MKPSSDLKMPALWILVAMLYNIVSCAVKPPHVVSLSANSNPPIEIEATEAMLKEAKEHQINALAPENFTDAEKALHKAKTYQTKGKPSETILEQVAFSRGWLKEAESKANILTTVLKDLKEARAGAINAGAIKQFPQEWYRTESELEKISAAAERGNLKPAEKEGNILTQKYSGMESASISKTYLSIANENIQTAKKQDAEKMAPRTYSLAILKRDNVENLIKSSPKSVGLIKKSAEDATRESVHLIDVLNQVKAGNSEELVLITERQARAITTLQGEHVSAEIELQKSKKDLNQAEKERQTLLRKQSELEKTQDLLKQAEMIRNQFNPNEAEVYAEDGKLMIRLKALQFTSGKTNLGPKNQAFLKKVQNAIAQLSPSKIIIEGHSDSIGPAAANKILSQKRAQAVREYLAAKELPQKFEVESIGKGAEEPISDNQTPRGRSENRRIDMIIETN